MSQALKKLINLMELEKIEEGLFRGQSEDLGLPQVFGGQVVGQALYAAKQTIADNRYVNSFHSYFLRPGDSHKPIVYDVESIRDGGSFSTRRVSTIQQGKPIFYMTVSFQEFEEGFEHQDMMPEVPFPNDLISQDEILKKLAPKLPEPLRTLALRETPFEARPVQYFSPFGYEKAPAERYVWYRSRGEMPSDPFLHQYLLGYISDFDFLPTSLQPYGLGFMDPSLQVATIDHSMWFHRPFRVDDWLLYAIESPSASGGRGFVRGKMFNMSGQLVASSVQEGVIRQKRIKSNK